MVEIKNRFTGEVIYRLDSANLSDADLSRANLSDADLSRADLSDANLRGADLSGADLSGANIPIYCKWSISFHNEMIQIGCKRKTIEDWDFFFSNESKEIFATARDSNDFKRIEAMYNAYKSYYLTLHP